MKFAFGLKICWDISFCRFIHLFVHQINDKPQQLLSVELVRPFEQRLQSNESRSHVSGLNLISF